MVSATLKNISLNAKILLNIAQMTLGFIVYCEDVSDFGWISQRCLWVLLNTAEMSLGFVEYCRDGSGFGQISQRCLWVLLNTAEISLGFVE